MTSQPESFPDIRRSNLSRYLILGLFAGLVLFPVLYYGISGELARWKQARAKLQYEAGSIKQAIALMEDAVVQSPRDWQLKLELSQMLMRHGQPARALEIVDSVLDGRPEFQSALEMRANCLLYLERNEQALQSAKKAVDLLKPKQADNPYRLNYRAYFRALAGQELLSARKDIDKAIDLTSREMWWLDQLPMLMEDQTLVAAAVVARHLDQSNPVLPKLNTRISYFEEVVGTADWLLSSNVYRYLQSSFPMLSDEENEVRRDVITLRSQIQFLAVLYSVRALIYQDLNRIEPSDRDRLRVKRLGYDADAMIDALPDDWQLLFSIYQGSQMLDTRAMVKYKSRQWQSALKDLDIAVLAAEVLNRSFSNSIQNTVRNESGEMYDAAEAKRMLAAVVKHRAQLHSEMGDSRKAEEDLKRVEELGFNRNEVLF